MVDGIRRALTAVRSRDSDAWVWLLAANTREHRQTILQYGFLVGVGVGVGLWLGIGQGIAATCVTGLGLMVLEAILNRAGDGGGQ